MMGACVSQASVTYRLTAFHQGLEVTRLTKTTDMAPRSSRKWHARPIKCFLLLANCFQMLVLQNELFGIKIPVK